MSDHISGVLGNVMATALALARKERLERDGVIFCWTCSRRPALLPSLACPLCLAEHYRATGTDPQCANRLQTPADAEAARCR